MKRRWLGSMVGLLCGVWMAASPVHADEAWLVEDGQPRARIVIADHPPRMVKLAATELRDYLKKITGAELTITNAPGASGVNIFVGKSAATEKLGLADDALNYGAYRMVSGADLSAGADYLVLLGQDADFVPPPELSQEEWEARTGSTWGNPVRGVGNSFNKASGLWLQDEGGSLNAVYGFLYDLGVRWYMPGELGEVVPTMASLPLPVLDKTVHPDYPVRFWMGSSNAITPWDDMIWERRVGMSCYEETLGVGLLAHGMRNVHGNKAMQEAHPEYYAWVGGQRDTVFRGTGHACFSSEGLLQETVNYVRAVFDQFDQPCVQLSPQDGLRQCQCEKCVGLAPSDYVFGFLNRVAQEVYKTHPDRLILGAAYSCYTDPPPSIDQFSPNLAISINNQGRPAFGNQERWDAYMAKIEGWQKKLAPGHLLRVENHIYSKSGAKGLDQPVLNPVIAPHAFARDLHALKGISMGERNEISRGKGRAFRAPAVDHLNYYVDARFLWDADQDIDALLDEYYTLFYGPAKNEVQAAFDYVEAELSRPGPRGLGPAEALHFVNMLQTARKTAGDTVYGRRLDAILGELASAETFTRMVDEKQAAAEARRSGPVAVVGNWAQPDALKTYTLCNLKTGEEADVATTFRVGWDKDAICFEITCRDPDMKHLFVSHDVWGGDSVAILLETPFHAYYQLEINPDGELVDADRENGRVAADWSSQAEVKTQRGEDFWRVTVRIPVADEAAGIGDPKNFVVGEKPSRDAPWFFNLGRVRIRDWEKNAYGFSPTGGNYHVPLKFGRLVSE